MKIETFFKVLTILYIVGGLVFTMLGIREENISKIIGGLLYCFSGFVSMIIYLWIIDKKGYKILIEF